jgi:hypothetical protein
MRTVWLKLSIFAPKKLYGGRTVNRSEIPHYAYTWPLIFHSYITEILYLSSIALAAKTYVKPVSDSVSWEKGWL